MKIKAPSTLVN